MCGKPVYYRAVLCGRKESPCRHRERFCPKQDGTPVFMKGRFSDKDSNEFFTSMAACWDVVPCSLVQVYPCLTNLYQIARRSIPEDSRRHCDHLRSQPPCCGLAYHNAIDFKCCILLENLLPTYFCLCIKRRS